MKTVEKVLYNPHTDKIGVGIRIKFMDKKETLKLDKLENYSIQLSSDECDGWIIDNQEGFWIYFNNNIFDEIVLIGDL